MMTRTVINAGAKQYFAQVEYYREAQSGNIQAPTRWSGKGAEALGLSGTVDFEDFEKLIEGRTQNGEALVQNAGREGRRMGWDLTFSQEKSLSILLADPTSSDELKDGIVEVHRHAVDAAMAHLETLLEVKTGKAGIERKSKVGMVTAMIDHFGTRDLCPQIHTHSVVANLGMTLDENNKPVWNSLSAEVLAQYEHSIGAVFRAASAAGAQKLGLKVDMYRRKDAKDRETGDVFWRVTGIDDTTYNASSKRSQEIRAYMEAHPTVSSQEANLATRKDKREPTYMELQEQWAKERTELRAAHPEAYKSCDALFDPSVKSNLGQPEFQPLDDKAILAKVVEMSSTFGRADLLKQVAQEYVGRLDARGVINKTNEMLEDQSLIQYFGRDKHQQHIFSTQAMIEVERGIGRAALARKNDDTVKLTNEQVEAGLARYNESAKFPLSDEQVASVHWLCANTGGVGALTGLAGAGKTSSFMAVRTTMEMAGREMLGVSTSWKAAGKLESETGIESYSSATILRQLNNNKLTLTDKHVLVFDEAGMAGSSTIAELQKHVDEAGAKLILMGDCLQLQPVSAGAGFRLAIADIGEAKLTEIRRQKSERMRETAGMFYGLEGNGTPNGAKIFDRLMHDGHVHTTENDKEAKDALVAAYFADETVIDEKLVLGGTRKEVMELNLAIREGYKERGALGPDHAVKLIVDGDFRTLQVALNDRVVFTEKNNALGVVNGDGGIVKAIAPHEDGKGHRITMELVSEIESKHGKIVEVDTNECQDLTYQYAMTTHKSQGQGLASVFAYFGEAGSKLIDNQLALVSFTRSKERYDVFGSKQVVMGVVDEHNNVTGGIAQRLGNVNLKQTTMDVTAQENAPVFSSVAAPENGITLAERLAALKAKSIAQSEASEKRSIAEHAKNVIAMDRAARATNGERDAQAVQQSAFVQALPDMAVRRQRVAEQKALADVQAREAARQKTLDDQELTAEQVKRDELAIEELRVKRSRDLEKERLQVRRR